MKDTKLSSDLAHRNQQLLELSREVYGVVLTESVTFHGRLGGNLAYLLGAIASSTRKMEYCQFSTRSQIVTILRNHFPADHLVWEFIDLVQWTDGPSVHDVVS